MLLGATLGAAPDGIVGIIGLGTIHSLTRSSIPGMAQGGGMVPAGTARAGTVQGGMARAT